MIHSINNFKSNLLKVLLVLATFVEGHKSYAQYQITGKVQTPQGADLERVTVSIPELKKATLTNNVGQFRLEVPENKPYKIRVSSIGYQTYEQMVSSDEIAVIRLRESVNQLSEVVVEGIKNAVQVSPLPDVHNSYVLAGKKSEVVQIGGVNANIAEKTGRQLFAKIPGVFVYDMDGPGNQVNISTRGLDPHRAWEYNVRFNGILTNSDMYGYPASHFSAPMEAIERVELIRGTGSLQYGAQFGGMINYVMKAPDTTRAFSFETLNSTGSFGMFSSYNAISGKVGKLTYQAYYQRRIANGYRQNARSWAEGQYAMLNYEFTKNLNIKAEFARSNYIYQIPGPLTDAMFAENPRQATRSRNFYQPDIYVPSLTLDWKIGKNTSLRWVNSGLWGNRNSVLFVGFANVPDVIDPATNQFRSRDVDIDSFKSFTSELRLMHHYHWGGMNGVLSSGVQLMRNNMRRRQVGRGTTGSDFDLSIIPDSWRRDMFFKTNNIALFVENLLYITPKWSISPGIRIENGQTDMTGKIVYYPTEKIPNQIVHRFPLLGISTQYRFNADNRFYAGISNAYRPVLFKDVIPGSVMERVNQNLKNATGYNLEAGVSGKLHDYLTYDIGVFEMAYNNRMGRLVERDALTQQNFVLLTNVGNSITRGIEAYLEYNFWNVRPNAHFSIFTSTSYFEARYTEGSVVVAGENRSIVGNRVEGVPQWISRNGLQYTSPKLSATLQYSYVSDSFSDPINTFTPTPEGARGIVPSYSLWDLNGTWRINRKFHTRFGINNILNHQYFTKRPLIYPGAGVWPSDGRSVVITVGLNL
ncbi:MAG: TonB-dependent receptor domain-containing protein [Runella sp.]